MMRKSKYLILCAVLAAMTLFAVGCGTNGDMNGTEAPYEDESSRKVNESQNGVKNNGTNGTSNNGSVDGDLERSGDSLKDAGRNLMDSVQETGDALRDGIDNLGNDMNDTNNMNRSDDANNTNNTGNTDNANNANNAGGMNGSR